MFMKKIRVFIYKHQNLLYGLLFFLFLFYFSYAIYQKTELWPVESFFKDISISFQNIITPKYQVDYHKTLQILKEDELNEVESLRELLNLENNSTYILEHASIINRSPIYYFDTITIDKGTKDGIDKDMLVITEKGLVGKIKYVMDNSSVVDLVTSKTNSFKVSVSVINGENKYNGIITGYDEKEEAVLVTSIRNQSQIDIGSKVITNGLGNLYPKGIEVGQVFKIEMDNVGVSKILSIKSDVDFKNLKYVSVIKGVQNDF